MADFPGTDALLDHLEIACVRKSSGVEFKILS